MVQKCANLYCGQPFRSANQGRLFSFDCGSGRIENYWLCFICCRRFRVVRAVNGAVRLVRNVPPVLPPEPPKPLPRVT
jgi:hypothetical protein